MNLRMKFKNIAAAVISSVIILTLCTACSMGTDANKSSSNETGKTNGDSKNNAVTPSPDRKDDTTMDSVGEDLKEDMTKMKDDMKDAVDDMTGNNKNNSENN